MANKLAHEHKRMIISALVEGNSIRSIERMTGVHRDTICRLLVRVGTGLEAMMRERFTGLDLTDVQVDEIWTYVGKHQARIIHSGERVKPDHGDQWVFVALDAETKLVPCWVVGKRSGENAFKLVRDLTERIDGRFQLTTDKFAGYKSIRGLVAAHGIDYGTQQKSYSRTDPVFGGYAPPRVSRCTDEVVAGNPRPEAISTSYAERQNLTMRMHMRRFTRLTNGFSKSPEESTRCGVVALWLVQPRAGPRQPADDACRGRGGGRCRVDDGRPPGVGGALLDRLVVRVSLKQHSMQCCHTERHEGTWITMCRHVRVGSTMTTERVAPQPTLKGYNAWVFNRLLKATGKGKGPLAEWVIDQWVHANSRYLADEFDIKRAEYPAATVVSLDERRERSST